MPRHDDGTAPAAPAYIRYLLGDSGSFYEWAAFALYPDTATPTAPLAGDIRDEFVCRLIEDGIAAPCDADGRPLAEDEAAEEEAAAAAPVSPGNPEAAIEVAPESPESSESSDASESRAQEG